MIMKKKKQAEKQTEQIEKQELVEDKAAENTVKDEKSASESKKTAKGVIAALCRRWFIDAFSGMAQGLFVTLIAGTILKTIGTLIGETTAVGKMFVFIGTIASVLMGAGIGVGIASKLKASGLVVFSAVVAGFIGAYSEQVIGASIGYSSITVNFNGSFESLAAFLGKVKSPGNPISAYVCALAAVEIGNLVSGKTKLDILLVPLTCVAVAFVGCFVSIPFIWLIKVLSRGIEIATGAVPFVMGVVIAVVMGMLLTLPTSSAAIWVAIASPVLSGAAAGSVSASAYNMYLAGGAAVVGCACHMVGFAVMSFRENGVAGLISQGIGTSMLQIPNVMKKPVLFLPPVIASAVCGPLSTCLFKLCCDASGGGMGTSGFVGVIGTVSAGNICGVPLWITLLGIALLMFILPAVICFFTSEFMRKKGIIKAGDLKI